MIFVDTSAWYAMAEASDNDHEAASRWFAQNKSPLLTTDYVVDETLTLLTTRGEPARARELGVQLFAGSIATLYFLTRQDILESWEAFQRFKDKDWSFTDCTSKIVLTKFGIKQAFTFDDHFRQFGTIEVVP